MEGAGLGCDARWWLAQPLRKRKKEVVEVGWRGGGGWGAQRLDGCGQEYEWGENGTAQRGIRFGGKDNWRANPWDNGLIRLVGGLDPR